MRAANWLRHLIMRCNIQALIVVKLLVLLLAGLALHDQLFFGETMLVAEDPKDQQEATDVAAKTETALPEQPASERHGFLEGLLELPEIDSTNLKKEEVSRYLTLAERKKKQVEERLKILSQRESKLKDLEKSIEDKIQRLEEERRYFTSTIQKEKELKGKRLESLIEFYKKMPPKKAAPVFEKLDKDLVVALFKQLPQKQIMNILSLMNPEKSVELTEYFARIRSGKEYDILKEMNASLRKEFADCKGMPVAKQDGAGT